MSEMKKESLWKRVYKSTATRVALVAGLVMGGSAALGADIAGAKALESFSNDNSSQKNLTISPDGSSKETWYEKSFREIDQLAERLKKEDSKQQNQRAEKITPKKAKGNKAGGQKAGGNSNGAGAPEGSSLSGGIFIQHDLSQIKPAPVQIIDGHPSSSEIREGGGNGGAMGGGSYGSGSAGGSGHGAPAGAAPGDVGTLVVSQKTEEPGILAGVKNTLSEISSSALKRIKSAVEKYQTDRKWAELEKIANEFKEGTSQNQTPSLFQRIKSAVEKYQTDREWDKMYKAINELKEGASQSSSMFGDTLSKAAEIVNNTAAHILSKVGTLIDEHAPATQASQAAAAAGAIALVGGGVGYIAATRRRRREEEQKAAEAAQTPSAPYSPSIMKGLENITINGDGKNIYTGTDFEGYDHYDDYQSVMMQKLKEKFETPAEPEPEQADQAWEGFDKVVAEHAKKDPESVLNRPVETAQQRREKLNRKPFVSPHILQGPEISLQKSQRNGHTRMPDSQREGRYDQRRLQQSLRHPGFKQR